MPKPKRAFTEISGDLAEQADRKAQKVKRRSDKSTKGVEIYSALFDPTLTHSQASKGGFKPELDTRDFRYRSNLTRKKYKTGYHEAVVTTDTFSFLQKAKESDGTTHTLGSASSSRSFFAPYSGDVVFSETLKRVLKLADGFRTDTAQTILSAPDGLVAGHTGSQVKTSNQAAAHDLLRQKVIEILKLDPALVKGMSDESIVALFGSITITSIAPATLARTVKGKTKSLKAKAAKATWEERRNEGKKRVKTLYDALDSDEQAFVHEHASSFLTGTLDPSSKPTREISSIAPNSPLRQTKSSDPEEVAGADYMPTLKLGPSAYEPSLRPPASLKERSLFITQPFREERRAIEE